MTESITEEVTFEDQTEKSIEFLKDKSTVLTSKLNKLSGRMDDISETEIEKTIFKFKDDAAEVWKMYRGLFFKIMIATELRVYLKRSPKLQADVLLGVFKAFDYGSEFWDDLEPKTLKTLATLFADIGTNYRDENPAKLEAG